MKEVWEAVVPTPKNQRNRFPIGHGSQSVCESESIPLKMSLSFNSPGSTRRTPMQRFEEMSRNEIERAMETQNTLMEQYNFDLKDYFGGPCVEDLDESCNDQRLKHLFNEVLFTEHENKESAAKGTPGKDQNSKLPHQRKLFSSANKPKQSPRLPFGLDEPNKAAFVDSEEPRKKTEKEEVDEGNQIRSELASKGKQLDLSEEKLDNRISSSFLSEISKKELQPAPLPIEENPKDNWEQIYSPDAMETQLNPNCNKSTDLQLGGFSLEAWKRAMGSSSTSSLATQNHGGPLQTTAKTTSSTKIPVVLGSPMSDYVSEVLKHLTLSQITDLLVVLFQRNPTEFQFFQMKYDPIHSKTKGGNTNWALKHFQQVQKNRRSFTHTSELFLNETKALLSPKATSAQRRSTKAIKTFEGYSNSQLKGNRDLKDLRTPEKNEKTKRKPRSPETANHFSCSPPRNSPKGPMTHPIKAHQFNSGAPQSSSKSSIRPETKKTHCEVFKQSSSQFKAQTKPTQNPPHNSKCFLNPQSFLCSSSLSKDPLIGLINRSKEANSDKKTRKAVQHISVDRKLLERVHRVKKAAGSSSSFVFNSAGFGGISPKSKEAEKETEKRGQTSSPKQFEIGTGNTSSFQKNGKSPNNWTSNDTQAPIATRTKSNVKPSDFVSFTSQNPKPQKEFLKAKGSPLNSSVKETNKEHLSQSKQVMLMFKNGKNGVKSDRKQQGTINSLEEAGVQNKKKKSEEFSASFKIP